MARIGLKGLTYARVSGGGAGSAVTYTASSGKTVADLMIRANVTYNRSNAKQHADDHAVESDNSITGVTVELELADLPNAQIADLLGFTVGTGDVITFTGDEAPYVGVGYITKQRRAGTVSYKGYWFYKAQFGLNNDNAETKAENTTFQSSTLSGEVLGVVQSASGPVDYVITKVADNEAAIRTWLNGLAGIS